MVAAVYMALTKNTDKMSLKYQKPHDYVYKGDLSWMFRF